jgi:hypothetical protein
MWQQVKVEEVDGSVTTMELCDHIEELLLAPSDVNEDRIEALENTEQNVVITISRMLSCLEARGVISLTDIAGIIGTDSIKGAAE